MEALVRIVDSSSVTLRITRYRGCVTPKVISNLKGAVEDDASNLDGYEDLPEELQVKVDKAIEEGHVADNDWRGVRLCYFQSKYLLSI